MAAFFIDTDTGQVATQKQLVEAGVAPASDVPPRPWFRIQGTGDATTLWYAVMRKQVKHVFIGALCLRHSAHHDLLLQRGYQEVGVDEMKAFAA
jgi:hypothetical protein